MHETAWCNFSNWLVWMNVHYTESLISQLERHIYACWNVSTIKKLKFQYHSFKLSLCLESSDFNRNRRLGASLFNSFTKGFHLNLVIASIDLILNNESPFCLLHIHFNSLLIILHSWWIVVCCSELRRIVRAV